MTCTCRAALEAKARLYEQMTKGDTVPGVYSVHSLLPAGYMCSLILNSILITGNTGSVAVSTGLLTLASLHSHRNKIFSYSMKVTGKDDICTSLKASSFQSLSEIANVGPFTNVFSEFSEVCVDTWL